MMVLVVFCLYGCFSKPQLANLPAPVAVTSGTQYWVVADTPSTGTGSDFYGDWAFVPPKSLLGWNTGGGWLLFPGDEEPAGAVYGTIP